MYEFAVTPAVTQLRRPGVIITEVSPGSLAEELELSPQDRITRVNGRQVRDYLDFRFQTAGETELTFQVKKPDGQTIERGKSRRHAAPAITSAVERAGSLLDIVTFPFGSSRIRLRPGVPKRKGRPRKTALS